VHLVSAVHKFLHTIVQFLIEWDGHLFVL
jgi:hypothetical protein